MDERRVTTLRASADFLITQAERARTMNLPRPATRLCARSLDWWTLTDSQLDKVAEILDWAEHVDPLGGHR